jgi:hypothetical protein
MASTSLSGHAQYEHSDDAAGQVFQVNALGKQPGSPFRGSIQDIPQAFSAMSVDSSNAADRWVVMHFVAFVSNDMNVAT